MPNLTTNIETDNETNTEIHEIITALVDGFREIKKCLERFFGGYEKPYNLKTPKQNRDEEERMKFIPLAVLMRIGLREKPLEGRLFLLLLVLSVLGPWYGQTMKTLSKQSLKTIKAVRLNKTTLKNH